MGRLPKKEKKRMREINSDLGKIIQVSVQSDVFISL
jgi:hypothetical protein